MRPVPLALLALSLLGCTRTGTTRTIATDGTRSEADDARSRYEEAYLEFRDGNCLEAEPIFREVKREYPHSRYAALAELRVGDCQMASDAYAEAIQTFQSFLRIHASHALVPYARFRIAEAHFEQIPSDWFLAPPSHERDLGSAEDALRKLRQFLLEYPEDEHIPAARRMAQRALDVLANHDLYAARFYDRRDDPTGVALRLEHLLYAYPGSSVEREAMELLVEAYRALGRDADAEAMQARLGG